MIKENKLLFVFISFVWFSLLFYVIALFLDGANQRFRDSTPWYYLILRDIISMGFVLYLSYVAKPYLLKLRMPPNYRRFLKWFGIVISIYLIIVFIHLFYKEARDILQHYIRNVILYSIFLFFLPVIFKSYKDYDFLVKNLLYAGVVLSIFGILTRYVAPDRLTWNGRIISTMADPNNLAIFLLLCMFIVVNQWGKTGFIKSIFLFSIYLIAFIMANSVTAFAVVNLGLLVILLLKTKIWKGLLFWLIIFYTMIVLSFSIKVIENPNKTMGYLIAHSFQEDRCLIDKLNNITNGKFSKIFLFGLETQIIETNTTSLTMRKFQIESLIEWFGSKQNPINLLIGDLNSAKYNRFDNQYLNFISNSGIIGLLVFIFIFGLGLYEGLKSLRKYKDSTTLPFSIFILSMLVLGFNGLAFLNRFPLNFLLYLLLGLIFLEKDIKDKAHES